jgi:hypothetical protein
VILARFFAAQMLFRFWWSGCEGGKLFGRRVVLGARPNAKRSRCKKFTAMKIMAAEQEGAFAFIEIIKIETLQGFIDHTR